MTVHPASAPPVHPHQAGPPSQAQLARYDFRFQAPDGTSHRFTFAGTWIECPEDVRLDVLQALKNVLERHHCRVLSVHQRFETSHEVGGPTNG